MKPISCPNCSYNDHFAIRGYSQALPNSIGQPEQVLPSGLFP